MALREEASSGGYLGVWEVLPHMPAYTHTHTHAHTCTYMLKYTDIANGYQHVYHDVVLMVPTWSPSSLCSPCHPYIILTSSPSSPHCPYTPETHPPTPWGTPGISKNSIRLELIEIFQFCLKFYDLLRHPHLWVGVWVVEWMGGLICGSMGLVRSYN